MRPSESTEQYHVTLVPKGAGTSDFRLEFELNLSFESIEQRFLMPYRRGQPMVIKGKTIATEELERIRIFKSEHKAKALSDVWDQEEVTQEFITGPPGSEKEAAPHSNQELTPPTDAQEVFVVHGRNGKARQAIFDFLRSIGLHPLEWSEAVQSTGHPSPYIGDILNAAFSKAHAVVVLMTPDDDAQLREPFRGDNDPPHETKLSGQARPNVLFEAGMAMGRNEDRTILVELGTLRPFSDIAGHHVIRFDNSTQRRQELAQRLRSAGCPVNLDGTDWHTAGDFEAALDLAVQMSSESVVAEEQQSTNDETPQLSEEAERLLLKGKYENGRILNAPTRDDSRRSVAKKGKAVEELIGRGLIKDVSDQGTVFDLTHEGFEVADSLKRVVAI